MSSRNIFARVAAVLAAGSLIALPACDWFQGSETGARQSPSINTLGINPASVLCGGTVSLSFRYDDPQGDIRSVKVKLTRVEDASVREVSLAWPEDKLRSTTGTLTFDDLSLFPCDEEIKGGSWAVEVVAVDEREHTSNALTGQIRLNAPG